MNMFVVFKKDNGGQNLLPFVPWPHVAHSSLGLELVTPPLDGMILPGITRDSVLALARAHASGADRVPDLTEKLVVSERPVNMAEIKAAAVDGSLVELFGTGTAAVISPVDRIGYLGEDVHIPTGPDGMGPVSRPLWKQLVGIQTGQIEHPWSVVVAE
jgi:branched-chain amino acid aminotransferase